MPLAAQICSIARHEKDEKAVAGLLNYAITTLITRVGKNLISELRYWFVALITGMLENVKQEFYRRNAVPYEDKQIAKNGDIDLF